MTRIYFTMYYAGIAILVAALIVIGIIRADAAVYIESHDPFASYTVYGALPEPIEIGVGFNYEAARFTYDSAWEITYSVTTGSPFGTYNEIAFGGAYNGIANVPGGLRFPDIFSNAFVLDNDHRVIGASINTLASYPDAIVYDAWISFYLPGDLSVTAPVPEPSTWVMLILAFGFISLFRLKKFLSGVSRGMSPAPSHWHWKQAATATE